MLRYCFILLLLYPGLELYILILAGGHLGFWGIVALLLLAAIAGFALLRARGMNILAKFQEEAAKGAIPSFSVFDTLCRMAAGWLLIFPGFISDCIALLLLIPFVRRALAATGRNFFTQRGFFSYGAVFSRSGTVSDNGHVVWRAEETTTRPPPKQRADTVIIDCEPQEISNADSKNNTLSHHRAG